MSVFKRYFKVPLLSDETTPQFFKDLLRAWAPAGTSADVSSDSGRFLRLAVRSGYLNFYYKGQSIAKVTRGKKRWKLEVHHKYLSINDPEKKVYARITDEAPDKIKLGSWENFYSSETSLVEWTKKSASHSHPEKRGVDLILSNPENADVIDIEVALPAMANDDKKTSPRMDIVMIESDCVRFWEAKTLDDSRLRAKIGLPKVVGQLKKYSDWMERESNKEIVARAYQDTRTTLIELWKLAVEFSQSEASKPPPLGAAIYKATKLKVDTKPCLVCFTGQNKEGAWLDQRGNWHKHRAICKNNGIQLIDNGADNYGKTQVDPVKLVLKASR